jgi:hypothetical protein
MSWRKRLDVEILTEFADVQARWGEDVEAAIYLKIQWLRDRAREYQRDRVKFLRKFNPSNLRQVQREWAARQRESFRALTPPWSEVRACTICRGPFTVDFPRLVRGPVPIRCQKCRRKDK